MPKDEKGILEVFLLRISVCQETDTAMINGFRSRLITYQWRLGCQNSEADEGDVSEIAPQLGGPCAA